MSATPRHYSTDRYLEPGQRAWDCDHDCPICGRWSHDNPTADDCAGALDATARCPRHDYQCQHGKYEDEPCETCGD